MKTRRQDGYAVILVLSLVILLGIIFSTYALITRTEVASSRNNARSTAGFYAAEAALNARTELVRQKFLNYQVPSGTAPSTTSPCVGSNTGSGDFACQTVSVNGRTTITYVVPGTAQNVVIGAGQLYAGLNASETPYVVYGQALNSAGNPEAIAQLTFRSRLVPLFQFAVFFNKDLEFSNTATLNLTGPVYAAGNIFLDSGIGSSLSISGQVLSTQTLYRGEKDKNTCQGNVMVANASNTLTTVNCNGSATRAMTTAELTSWGGQMQQNVSPVTVPTVDSLQPQSGVYWNKADLRIVLKSTGYPLYPWVAQVQDSGGNLMLAATYLINSGGGGCSSALNSSTTFRDNRENASSNKPMMLQVDMSNLLNCIRNNSGLLGMSGYTGTSADQGLVLYFTVDDSATSNVSQGTLGNNYGVELINGDSLHASSGASRSDLGVTAVSDQAVYIDGNYNSPGNDSVVGKVPASILADSINVLSNDWDSGYTGCSTGSGSSRRWWNTSNQSYSSYTQTTLSGDSKSTAPLACRPAGTSNSSNTTVNAAILAGTDISGVNNGTAVDEDTQTIPTGSTSGGVHNMMRFQEEWGSNGGLVNSSGYYAVTYNYRGSLVSLGRPLHARGNFQVGAPIYNPPSRNWKFDTDFRDATKLPPLSPRFVYVQQDNFVRNFQQ